MSPPPPTFACVSLGARTSPAIKKIKQQQPHIAAAACPPQKTTRSITHALLHSIHPKPQDEKFIREPFHHVDYRREETVESLLQTQKKKKMVFKRDMPLRGALNTILKICVYGAAATCCHFFFFWGLLKTFKRKKTRAPPGPLQPRRPPVAKKKYNLKR